MRTKEQSRVDEPDDRGNNNMVRHFHEKKNIIISLLIFHEIRAEFEKLVFYQFSFCPRYILKLKNYRIVMKSRKRLARDLLGMFI